MTSGIRNLLHPSHSMPHMSRDRTQIPKRLDSPDTSTQSISWSVFGKGEFSANKTVVHVHPVEVGQVANMVSAETGHTSTYCPHCSTHIDPIAELKSGTFTCTPTDQKTPRRHVVFGSGWMGDKNAPFFDLLSETDMVQLVGLKSPLVSLACEVRIVSRGGTDSEPNKSQGLSNDMIDEYVSTLSLYWCLPITSYPIRNRIKYQSDLNIIKPRSGRPADTVTAPIVDLLYRSKHLRDDLFPSLDHWRNEAMADVRSLLRETQDVAYSDFSLPAYYIIPGMQMDSSSSVSLCNNTVSRLSGLSAAETRIVRILRESTQSVRLDPVCLGQLGSTL